MVLVVHVVLLVLLVLVYAHVYVHVIPVVGGGDVFIVVVMR